MCGGVRREVGKVMENYGRGNRIVSGNEGGGGCEGK